MHATPPRRPPASWLWTGVALASALALTVLMIRLQETACATAAIAGAAPQPGETPDTYAASRRGSAVFHAPDRRTVSCSFGTLSGNGFYVALSSADYAGAAACGTYFDITGPRGMVRVQAVDRCRGCGPGELDLSRGAFARIADPARVRVPIRYLKVRDPQPVHHLSFRVKPGSSGGRLGLLALGHGNPLDRLEIRPPGRGWRTLQRGFDNYWTASDVGQGPFAVRVTDVFGHRVVVGGVAIVPRVTQWTYARLYPPSRGLLTAARSPVRSPGTAPTPSARSMISPQSSRCCPSQC